VNKDTSNVVGFRDSSARREGLSDVTRQRVWQVLSQAIEIELEEQKTELPATSHHDDFFRSWFELVFVFSTSTIHACWSLLLLRPYLFIEKLA